MSEMALRNSCSDCFGDRRMRMHSSLELSMSPELRSAVSSDPRGSF